jgi:hypothetical protein
MDIDRPCSTTRTSLATAGRSLFENPADRAQDRVQAALVECQHLARTQLLSSHRSDYRKII